MNTNKHKLNEVWDYLSGNQTLGDLGHVSRGKISDKNADKMKARGECVACKTFADGAMIHESPGTAKCCKGCPAAEKSL